MPFWGLCFPCFFSEWTTLSLVKVHDEFRDFPLEKPFILLYSSEQEKLLNIYAFRIRELSYTVVWHLKPRNPKSQSVGPTPFHLLEIRELSYIVVWYLKPWNPEILKWWSHILSLFRIQELLCIVVWYLKPRNPKIPKWWSHILSLFKIRELLCIVVWYLKPRNPEILKPKIPKWLSHILSPIGIRELLCMVVWYWNPEIRKPEILKCGTHIPFFHNLDVCMCGFLGTCTREILISEFLKY